MGAEDLFDMVELGEEVGPVPGLRLTLKAAANITKGQLVVMDTHTDQEPASVNVAGAGAADVVGVALEDIASGAWGSVLIHGIVKVTAAGAITAGTKIQSAASGQVQAAAATATVPTGTTAVTSTSANPAIPVLASLACGRALQDAGEAGDEIIILIGGA